MDEMRLVFAKKAEALNRAMEEKVDTFSEIFVVDTVAEAEQQALPSPPPLLLLHCL